MSILSILENRFHQSPSRWKYAVTDVQGVADFPVLILHLERDAVDWAAIEMPAVLTEADALHRELPKNLKLLGFLSRDSNFSM